MAGVTIGWLLDRAVVDLGKHVAAAGVPADTARILAITTEIAQSLFGLGGYADAGQRLWGIMWGTEDLSVSLGARATARKRAPSLRPAGWANQTGSG